MTNVRLVAAISCAKKYTHAPSQVELGAKLLRHMVHDSLSKLGCATMWPPPMPTLVQGETLRVSGLAVENGSNVLHEPSHDPIIDWKSGPKVSFQGSLQCPQQIFELLEGALG